MLSTTPQNLVSVPRLSIASGIPEIIEELLAMVLQSIDRYLIYI